MICKTGPEWLCTGDFRPSHYLSKPPILIAKVSIILVNYTGCTFLDNLLTSLARQTRPAEEVILVDNVPSDEGGAALTELEA